MGLKIAQFKKNGNTYTDAYAKIGGVNYNNDTKIATFSIAIYPSKDDNNLITQMTNYYTKVQPTDDIRVKCYARINGMIADLKAQIAEREARKLEIVNDQNKVLQVEAQIAQLLKSDLLQLDGGVEW
jgi:hypothetical protein